jgi:hypothetical protein
MEKIETENLFFLSNPCGSNCSFLESLIKIVSLHCCPNSLWLKPILHCTAASVPKMQNPFKASGKTPYFEYAFSYFQQMARDAVDGRTINVVLYITLFIYMAFI